MNRLLTNILLLLLILPLTLAVVRGPYDEYVDYGKEYDLKRTVGLEANSNATVECFDSLGNNFDYTLNEDTPNPGWNSFICNFVYSSPSSGKGIDNIDFTVRAKYPDEPATDYIHKFNLYYGYCPNVACQSGEECIEHECITVCGNGKIDEGETCSTCPQDVKCTSYERCTNGVCMGFCGNGRTDNGETCSSCPQDVSCRQGWVCADGKCRNPQTDSSFCGSGRISCGNGFCINGQCVQCRNNKDCESKKIYGEGFECSPDRKHVLEKGYELSGLCKEGKCTGEKVALTPREYEDCGNKGCQDGHCGCSDGYKLCTPILECRKPGSLKENAKCNCDFECESGYCSEDKRCINTLNVKLSANKDIIKVGEQTSVTLSVDNNLNKVINTNLAINIGNGFDITEVDGGMHCSGNQCKSSLELSERSRTKIIIVLEGKTANVVPLNAEVTYFMDDKVERTIPKIEGTKVIITECGDGRCTEGENMQNCCTDCRCPEDTLIGTYVCGSIGCERKVKKGFLQGVLISLLVASMVGYLAYRTWKGDEERRKKVRKEIKEKKHILKVLESMKLSKRKPPTTKQIIEKLRKEYDITSDKKLITEAYNEFLNRVEEGKGTGSIKPEAHLVKKFCSKCGTVTRESVSFCNKCGASIVKSSSTKILRYCTKCGKGLNELNPFCPYCGKRTRSQSSASIKHKTYMEDYRTDYRIHKTKGRKSKLIAVLLALFLYPIAAGYIYLGKWKKFWISIIIIWGLIGITNGGAIGVVIIYALWTVYDCYQLAKRT